MPAGHTERHCTNPQTQVEENRLRGETEVGQAEIGQAEVGQAEVGQAEVGLKQPARAYNLLDRQKLNDRFHIPTTMQSLCTPRLQTPVYPSSNQKFLVLDEKRRASSRTLRSYHHSVALPPGEGLPKPALVHTGGQSPAYATWFLIMGNI